MKNKNLFRKNLFHLTTNGTALEIRCIFYKKTNHIGFSTSFYKSSDGGYENNKMCAQFLGIHIAERILSSIYPNVKLMSNNNRGYDFTCGKGYKIDVKSGCMEKCHDTWAFHIRRNKIADYFLCLAFDNRNDLNPQHIWLIPGNILNDKLNTSISKSTLSKWSQYEQPLDKIISCCNTLKGDIVYDIGPQH